MSEQQKPPVGSIVWRDLTVKHATDIRDFYDAVIGWQTKPHPMPEQDDFDVYAVDGEEPIAGICHAEGFNADIPPQWLIYVQVADVAASAERCTALGGKVITGPRNMGTNNFCVIQDPAGAMMALID